MPAFEWDEGNVDHIDQHGVTPPEAEEALLDPRRVGAGAYNREGERRSAVIGATEDGRLRLVVYPWRHGNVRVVTARDADQAQRRRYRRENMTRRSRRTKPEPARRPIERWDEVPPFASEQEEQAFWDTHTLGEGLLAQMERGGPDDLRGLGTREPTRSRTIAVRFEDDVLKRVRAVAAKKHMGYQTLLKGFVLERLYEEEKREGLIA